MVIQNLVAQRTGINISKVEKVLQLLEQGNTIPFIARYRKEFTGSLDEVQIQSIELESKKLNDLIQRKSTILQSIEEQGKLTPQLSDKINNCFDSNQLEDIYSPFKRKKKTKADIARELGLESLAKIIMAQNSPDIHQAAARFVRGKIVDEHEAIEKALDIVKEWIAENEYFRERFRESFRRYGDINSKVVKTKKEQAATYKDYFDFSEKLSRCPSHRYLAMMRGESEGLLRVKLTIDDERAISFIEQKYIKRNGTNETLIKEACKSAYKDYILPSVENQIKKEYKEIADEAAIKVFTNNLEQLLLSPPFGNKPVLAIDPGFRTGCKVACVDETGTFLESAVIFPHEPQLKKQEAISIVNDLISKYDIKGIAIGNGTASRETKEWIGNVLKDLPTIEVHVISESGASIYSASDVAREEFPNLDLTVRGAISLARRLLDPLSELIKVDPKSIGVGQYQHDVNQTRLKDALDQTVVSSVNRVGVDLNTTSHHLLSYISGLGVGLAKNIVEYRSKINGFEDIKQLNDVPRLGAKAFEQCAGFLRIRTGINPLDNTGIHPESYHIVHDFSAQLGTKPENLVGSPTLVNNASEISTLSSKYGKETVDDIVKELLKPGHDPRGKAQVFEFDKNIRTIANLRIGMRLPGIVSNLTNFGAFVDIGIKQDGLIHVSQISDKRISSPMEVLSLNQKVWVIVTDIDVPRNRISLSMKS